ncbi:MAG: hypothetical protein JXA97_03900 [Anaerolineales bacterium]|nr:hypothetical protein [Anaerolineales bacterium]
MRKAILLLMSLASMLAACSPQAASPGESEVATIVAATLNASAAAADSPTQPTPPTDPPMATPPIESVLVVAYTIDGNLWTIADEAPPVQRTAEGGITSVRLSDDGARIAYVRSTESGDNTLHVYNLDTSTEHLLLNESALDALLLPEAGAYLRIDTANLMFLPDSHELFFSTRLEFEGPGLRPNNDLYRIDVDTGELTPIFGQNGGGNLFLSPDGSVMAITTPITLRFAAIDGTLLGAERLSFEPVLTYSEFAYYPQAVWTPDSRSVYTLIPSPDPLAPDAFATIWQIPWTDLPPVSIQTIPGGLFMLDAFGSSWIDPNGENIASLETTGIGNERALSITPLAGGAATLIAAGTLEWEGWSPDGAIFSYSTLGDDAALILASLDGSREVIPAGRRLIWLDGGAVVLTGERGSWSILHRSLDGSPRLLAELATDWTAFDAVLR